MTFQIFIKISVGRTPVPYYYLHMKSILICDDDSEVREILELILKDEFDVDVVHAANGVEGIAMCSDKFDLIISDYNMPMKNGEALFDHNVKSDNTPYLLLNGGAVPRAFLRKVEAGEYSKVLDKPCKDQDLLEAVKSLISLRDRRS